MTNFEKWKDRYNRGWATAEQMQRLVALNILTQNECDLIIS